MKALRGVKNYEAGGLLPGPVDLNANLGKQSTCDTFVQITPNGQGWRLLNPQLQCGSLIGRRAS